MDFKGKINAINNYNFYINKKLTLKNGADGFDSDSRQLMFDYTLSTDDVADMIFRDAFESIEISCGVMNENERTVKWDEFLRILINYIKNDIDSYLLIVKFIGLHDMIIDTSINKYRSIREQFTRCILKITSYVYPLVMFAYIINNIDGEKAVELLHVPGFRTLYSTSAQSIAADLFNDWQELSQALHNIYVNDAKINMFSDMTGLDFSSVLGELTDYFIKSASSLSSVAGALEGMLDECADTCGDFIRISKKGLKNLHAFSEWNAEEAAVVADEEIMTYNSNKLGDYLLWSMEDGVCND